MHKIIIIVSISILLLTSCDTSDKKTQEQKPIQVQSYNMGTLINQTVFGENAKKASDEVSSRIAQIEEKMTVATETSEISKVNKSAGQEEFIDISADTKYVLEKSKFFNTLSQGRFDITLGPLITLWNILSPTPKVPTKEKIEELKPLIGSDDIEFSKDSVNKVKLKRKGQAIDLGAIAKGYAGDEAISIYKKYNITSAYINLGGNVCTLGKKPDGTPWKIGIQNPRSTNGRYIGLVELTDNNVVTSGDYERYFEVNNTRYHHILDPKTGYPSKSDLISATIVAPSSIDADGLSTTCFVAGLEESFKILKQYKNAGGIFITDKKEVYISKELEGKFKFEDESKEFKYAQSR